MPLNFSFNGRSSPYPRGSISPLVSDLECQGKYGCTYAPTGTYECTYALCMHVVCLCVRALVLIAPRYPVRSSVNARRRRYYFAIERAHGGLIKSHESGYLPGPMHKLPPKTRPNLLPSLSCTREGEGDRTRGIYGRVPRVTFRLPDMNGSLVRRSMRIIIRGVSSSIESVKVFHPRVLHEKFSLSLSLSCPQFEIETLRESPQTE